MDEVHAPQRAGLRWLQLLGLAYIYTCGGPYGIEGAVQSAGALACIIALFVAGLVWALPQALITAELSSKFPETGSPLLFVDAALGSKRWTAVYAATTVVGQIFDLALWPGLLTQYASGLIPSLSAAGPAAALQVAAVLVVCAANVMGVQLLAVAAAVACCISVGPFVLMPAVLGGEGLHLDWAAAGPAGTPAVDGNGWALFGSTMLWTFQGFVSVGALAGDVADPRATYPLVMLVVVCLVVATYALPIALGVALHPNLNDWNEAYFTSLMSNIAPWLGGWTAVGAAVANFGSGMSATAMYSRLLAAVADKGLAPGILGRTWVPRTGAQPVPVAAIVFMTITNLALMSLPFQNLVVVDSLFNLLSLILVLVSFLRLRYMAQRQGTAKQDAAAAYIVPGGMPVAWLLTVTLCLLACGAGYLVSLGAWPQVVGALATAVGAFGAQAAREAWCSSRRRDGKHLVQDYEDEDESSGEGGFTKEAEEGLLAWSSPSSSSTSEG